MSRSVRRFAAASVTVLLLAACGNSGDEEPEAQNATESSTEADGAAAADDADGEDDGDASATELDPPTVNGVALSDEAMPAAAASLFDGDARGEVCERMGIDEDELLARIEGPPQPDDFPEVEQYHGDESVSCSAMATIPPTDDDGHVTGSVLPALLVQAWRYDPPTASFVTEDDDVTTIESPAGHTYETARMDHVIDDTDLGEIVYARLYSHDPPMALQVRAHGSFTVADDVDELAAILDGVLAALGE